MTVVQKRQESPWVNSHFLAFQIITFQPWDQILLCQCSKTILWQHGPNLPCKQTHKITSSLCYIFPSSQSTYPCLSGGKGREEILVTPFGYDLVVKNIKKPCQSAFPTTAPHSLPQKNPVFKTHFRMHTRMLAKLWAWWFLCFQFESPKLINSLFLLPGRLPQGISHRELDFSILNKQGTWVQKQLFPIPAKRMVSAMKHFSNASPLGEALGLQSPRGLAAAFSMARCATASLGLQIKLYTHDSLLLSHSSTRQLYRF